MAIYEKIEQELRKLEVELIEVKDELRTFKEGENGVKLLDTLRSRLLNKEYEDEEEKKMWEAEKEKLERKEERLEQEVVKSRERVWVVRERFTRP